MIGPSTRREKPVYSAGWRVATLASQTAMRSGHIPAEDILKFLKGLGLAPRRARHADGIAGHGIRRQRRAHNVLVGRCRPPSTPAIGREVRPESPCARAPEGERRIIRNYIFAVIFLPVCAMSGRQIAVTSEGGNHHRTAVGVLALAGPAHASAQRLRRGRGPETAALPSVPN
jgi:hypothetical protein